MHDMDGCEMSGREIMSRKMTIRHNTRSLRDKTEMSFCYWFIYFIMLIFNYKTTAFIYLLHHYLLLIIKNCLSILYDILSIMLKILNIFETTFLKQSQFLTYILIID